MGKYIDADRLARALTPATYGEFFNDDGEGNVDTDAVVDVIDRAEGEVDSQLIGFRTYPIDIPTDRLLRQAALCYAISFSFERHPEYVRQFGENPRADGMYQRGEKLMARVQAGIKALPDQTSPATAAQNSGGIVYDSGPRFSVDSLDGTQNGSGF